MYRLPLLILIAFAMLVLMVVQLLPLALLVVLSFFMRLRPPFCVILHPLICSLHVEAFATYSLPAALLMGLVTMLLWHVLFLAALAFLHLPVSWFPAWLRCSCCCC